MRRALPSAALITVLLASLSAAVAQKTATFAGMTCLDLTEEQRQFVAQVNGEAAGLYIKAVEPDSLAAKSGIVAGSFIISTRRPTDTDYYMLRPDVEDFAASCKQLQPPEKVRLIVLRKAGDDWEMVKVLLGKPMGEEVPDGRLEEADEPLEDHVAGQALDFVSKDPDKVVATSPNGDTVTQRDVDLYGSLMGWAFGVRLTEAQKALVRDTMLADWQRAGPQEVQTRDMLRKVPVLLPQMTDAQREQLRLSFQTDFLGKVQIAPDHPLAKLIVLISANARNVLAGAGTPFELTQQDVDALLEFLCFQAQAQTGQAVAVTPEQREAFTKQTVEYFGKAGDQQKQTLAGMEEMWGMLRAYWAAAQAAQQQALMQQWQQAYAQQRPVGNMQPMMGWPTAFGGGGGEMSDSQFNTCMDALNNLHHASMDAIHRIADDEYGAMYDGAGNWLYSF